MNVTTVHQPNHRPVATLAVKLLVFIARRVHRITSSVTTSIRQLCNWNDLQDIVRALVAETYAFVTTTLDDGWTIVSYNPHQAMLRTVLYLASFSSCLVPQSAGIGGVLTAWIGRWLFNKFLKVWRKKLIPVAEQRDKKKRGKFGWK